MWICSDMGLEEPPDIVCFCSNDLNLYQSKCTWGKGLLGLIEYIQIWSNNIKYVVRPHLRDFDFEIFQCVSTFKEIQEERTTDQRTEQRVVNFCMTYYYVMSQASQIKWTDGTPYRLQSFEPKSRRHYSASQRPSGQFGRSILLTSLDKCRILDSAAQYMYCPWDVHGYNIYMWTCLVCGIWWQQRNGSTIHSS